jgi:hypothetical protein
MLNQHIKIFFASPWQSATLITNKPIFATHLFSGEKLRAENK